MERHLQTPKAFRAQYVRIAHELAEQESDPEFRKQDVSNRQFQRWLDGQRPRPYACRIIEHMLDRPIDDLLRPVSTPVTQVAPASASVHEPSPTFGGRLKQLREQRGLSFRRLAEQVHYSHGYLWDLETKSKSPTDAVASALDTALHADGELIALAAECHQAQGNRNTSEERNPVKRRSLAVGGVAACDAVKPSLRALQALDTATADQADTLGVATDCLNELISHYAERLSVSPPHELYSDLLNIRSYAGHLLVRGKSSPRKRSDIVVAAGWLSSLLAIATSYMGDHGSALVWCVDAERRSHESGFRELAGWAALTRSMMAYYQGRAGRSVELASKGRGIAPLGSVVHAKLTSQEMRACAMLGDSEGMMQAKRRATKAIAELPADVPTTGVFSIALSEDPPYTATSLLLVNRYREAASATRIVIGSAYPQNTRNQNRQSSSYARTLLILGLAEAGLGHVSESAAVGRMALASSGPVWPTLVLAGKLDSVLMRDNANAPEVIEYHSHYLDMINLAASEFAQLAPATTTRG